jgi:DNA-binding SARP family transcriptional activator
MAVLVLLAHAGPAGVSRDRLLAWLWPESDEPRARAALDQVLYVLRRVLGADTLVETTALHLAPGVLASDALDFEAAAAAGDAAAAVERYGGPFLDGIHFSDAPELDRWVADTRARLSTLHQAALVRLARAAEARDAWRDAAAWWRRAVETDPLAAGAAIGLVRALARADDRAAALRAAEVHAALVREELGSEPDPRVRAAADEGPASSPVGLPRPDVIPAVVPNASDGVAPRRSPARPAARRRL